VRSTPSTNSTVPERPAEPGRTGRRRADRRPLPLPGRWVLVGIAIAFVIGIVGALSFTQTTWGRAQILRYTLQALGGRLNGQLTIDRVEGNLFTGARLYNLALRDHDGIHLAMADSATIQYRVATFLGGDIVINRLVLWNADINIFRMPGDTVWNYQEILQDPTPGITSEEEASAVFIERLRLNQSRIRVRGPLEPDPRLSSERQRLAIEEILADTARWMIEEVPGGYLRETRIDIADGVLTELFVGPDERGGIYFEVQEAVADVRLWRDPPLEIQALRAQLHLREGLVNYHAMELQLPDSRGESIGGIDLRGDRPMYDVVVFAPRFALSDLRWLYPWLPEDPRAGGGSTQLRIVDRPDDLLVLADDLVLEMPNTRVTGQFGLITGEVIRFTDVELEAEPLDLEEIERLLPEDLPIEGLRIGSAVIRGR
jgi:hypothetical protein